MNVERNGLTSCRGEARFNLNLSNLSFLVPRGRRRVRRAVRAVADVGGHPPRAQQPEGGGVPQHTRGHGEGEDLDTAGIYVTLPQGNHKLDYYCESSDI